MAVGKLLLQESAGEFLLTINMFLMLANFSSGGINNLILSRYSSSVTGEGRLPKDILFLNLISFVFLSILLIGYFVLGLFIDELPLELSITLILGAALHLLQIQISNVYLVKGKVLKAIFLESIAPQSIFLCLLFAFQDGDIIRLYLIAFGMVYAVTLISTVRDFDFRIEAKEGILSEHVSSIRPFFLVAAVSAATAYLPVQVGSLFVDLATMSVVIIALKISGLIRIIYMAIMNVYVKKMALSFSDHGVLGLNKQLKSLSYILMVFAVIFSFLLYFLVPYIQDYLGRDYEKLDVYLLVLYIGQCIFVSLGGVGYALMISKNESALQHSMILSLIICMVITYFMIQIMGPLGLVAGISTIIAGQHIAAYISCRYKLGFRLFGGL